MIQHCHILSMIAALLLTSSGNTYESEADSRHPNLTMHGNSYPNSCAPHQRKNLVREIEGGSLPDWKKLQKAIDAILCKSPSSNKEVLSIIDDVVIMSYEGTAEEKVIRKSSDKMEILDQIMAEGKAWNARLRIGTEEVTLQYFSNEACIESVKFHHSRGAWLISGIGGACD